VQKLILAIFILIVVLSVATTMSCKHFPDESPIVQPMDTTGGGDTTKITSCDPDSVYFENSILPLLTSSCAYAGCHDDISRQGGIILTTYSNIISTGDIKPGNPSGSKLYEVIVETRSEKVMPPPPNNTLTTEQKALVKKWIEQGAKNNKCEDCDSTIVTYALQVTSVINANCVACHNAASASGNVSLHNYAAVKSNVDNGKLNGAINHLSGFVPMPPSGKLNSCNLTIIRKWIDNGALNN
jgi:cytochrome c5